jgi:hypothetical protein
LGPALSSEPGLWGEGAEPELNVPVESGVRLMGEGEAEPELSAVHEEVLAIRAWEVSSTFVATTNYAPCLGSRGCQDQASHRDYENRAEGGCSTISTAARVFRVSGRCGQSRRPVVATRRNGKATASSCQPISTAIVITQLTLCLSASDAITTNPPSPRLSPPRSNSDWTHGHI